MTGHRKSAPGETVNVRQASRQFEYSAAPLAMKVVMVRLSRPLVDGGAPRKFNGRQPAFLQKDLDVPVNCRDSQALRFTLGRLQNLLRRKRPVRAFKSLANRRSLPRVPLISAGHNLTIARYR